MVLNYINGIPVGYIPNGSREDHRTVHISIVVSPNEFKLWNEERKKLKMNPPEESMSMCEFIRDRVNESFEPIDVIAGRKFMRCFNKKWGEENNGR